MQIRREAPVPRVLLLCVLLAAGVRAGEVGDPADVALGKLQPASGIRVELFAAEPDVTNPVGIWVDDRGRVFLAETRRYNTAALYVKQHPLWYFDDLACRTVEERIGMARRFMGERFSVLSEKSEVVRLIEDRSGAGKATHSSIFAEGFSTPADGVACSVLVRGNDVWLANVPRLWHLRDTDNDGRADERTALQDGYGVRFGNSGHDLHGLTWGPDGKLYFSMGDRGMHVETEGRTFAHPDTGTVLRCDADGSNFEVYALGLRNPQGLAFDDFGNLFTADNNADVGDEARWVHVLDGGDSGWRTGFQYASDPWIHEPMKPGQYLVNNRHSPWMGEDLWKGAAAYQVPPSGFVSRGPCGLTAYPGTGLSERYDGTFFLTDFPGGVHAFGLKPNGPTYAIEGLHKFLWECWPTDAKFGPDGHLYVCDWVYGFPMTGKGRVFRAFDAAESRSALVLEVKKLLGEGFGAREVKELVALLGHRDRRVRQEAQFELARRREFASLAATAAGEGPLLARVHAIWGLGQTGVVEALVPLLKSPDAEVRTQAARVLGERVQSDAVEGLAELLKDAQPRVRLHAALALGRIGRGAGTKKERVKPALPALLQLLRENGGDGFLRHGAVMGLAGCAELADLLDAARDPAARVRMGVLLALRRLERPEIAQFLNDADGNVAFEAARAINDVPIDGARAELAVALERTGLPEGALLRAINANFRIGSAECAARLARFAQRRDVPEALRAEALGALGGWGRPAQRDRVATVWRPLKARGAEVAVAALAPAQAALFEDPSDAVRIALTRAAVSLKLDSAAALERLAREKGHSAALRVEALKALGRMQAPGFENTVGVLVRDADVAVRKEAIACVPQLRSPDSARVMADLALSDAAAELRQAAIAALSRIAGPASVEALGVLLGRLEAGTLPPELALDVLEAAQGKPEFSARLTAREAALVADDPTAVYRVTLAGGDATRGKRVFFEHAEAACLRCHKVGKSGGDVGPPLSAVGQRSKLEILESILLPNKAIVQGYGQELIAAGAEGTHLGRVKNEDAAQVTLVLADGQEKSIPKSAIKRRKPALSAMPEDMGRLLSKRDLRDLVAYLAGLK